MMNPIRGLRIKLNPTPPQNDSPLFCQNHPTRSENTIQPMTYSTAVPLVLLIRPRKHSFLARAYSR